MKKVLSELVTAAERAILAGIGAGVGVAAVSDLSSSKEWAAAGIAAGTAALGSLAISLRTINAG